MSFSKIISGVVKALADFIEFDEAADLGTRRNPDLNELAESQRDIFWQRLARAGADTTRMRDLPWHDAERELTRRRRDSKAALRHREIENENLRAIRDAYAS